MRLNGATTVVSFLGQTVLATLVSIVLGIILSFLLALPFGYFGSGAGNAVDRAGNTWLMRYGINEPYFVVPVLMGACFGYMVSRRSKSWAGAVVWIVPSAILLYNLISSLADPSTGITWFIENYFTAGCGSTECLYELFVTVPFYTSIAYSLGWMIHRRIFDNKKQGCV
jgi:ABC-type dipeptide/oligopeptide/nickel transport system permease component